MKNRYYPRLFYADRREIDGGCCGRTESSNRQVHSWASTRIGLCRLCGTLRPHNRRLIRLRSNKKKMVHIKYPRIIRFLVEKSIHFREENVYKNDKVLVNSLPTTLYTHSVSDQFKLCQKVSVYSVVGEEFIRRSVFIIHILFS